MEHVFVMWGLGGFYNLNTSALRTLEHSHPVSSNYSILPSQKLLYLLYNTILQHTQHPDFYIPIQHIKIIDLHNKIYNPKKYLSSLSNFCLSSSPSLSHHREQTQSPTQPPSKPNHPTTVAPPANHQQHNLPPPLSTTQPTTIINNTSCHHHH